MNGGESVAEGERHPIAAEVRDACFPRLTAAVEECHGVTDFGAENANQVAGLVPFEEGAGALRGRREEESFAHGGGGS